MNIPILGDLIKEIGETAREFIPDADKKLELDHKFRELQDRVNEREHELLKGQIEINKEEAKNSNLFVAGWRPFIGWVSGGTLAYTWVGAPLLKWVADLTGHIVSMPAVSADDIMPVVLAMLGIGAMRTYEKTKGVATSIGGKILRPVEVNMAPEVSSDELPSKPKKSRWFK